MKKYWEKIKEFYRNSKYIKPIIIFILFFLVSGILMYFAEVRENEVMFRDIVDGVWWSIVTFSTTGYGDKYPLTMSGRIIAVITIVIGIGAVSLLSGELASLLVDRNTKARRGLMDFRKVKEHLIICGWKDDMKEILMDIIELSAGLYRKEIILISNVSSDKIEALQDETVLKNIKFVRGDYFSEAALQRANVKGAKKVLILADTLESAAASEVDSKTVMTVLTIKSIARDVYVCAELLDQKYESYLKQAMCDEILFSRDFERRMLANSSATNGMSHIIYSLLTHEEDSSRLATFDIPPKFVNKTFAEFKDSLNGGSSRILLGILENTGSPNRMKIEALREAQKTSDISQLVSNLQEVKGLEVNKPVFLPKEDYVIQKHSLAIILERE